MSTATAIRAYRGPAVFSIGLRPFYLFSALWSAIIAPLWIHAFLGGGPIGLDWHVHEMLFGYAGGIIVGFLLTAVPNWTGRMPVVGWPLVLLFGLWVAGRAAMLTVALNADVAAMAWPVIVDCLFLVAVAGVVWREVLAGRNWRNLPVAMIVTVLALANIGFHLETGAGGVDNLSTRLGLSVVSLLIALIGGRVTPSFTRNWQLKRGGPLPAVAGRFDTMTLIATAAGLAAWSFAPVHPATGVALLLAGVLNLIRLARWRGGATLAEPLVLILHLGYLWLASGLVLLGLSVMVPAHVLPSVGVHALTAGAIGVMTLAIMTRSSRGHTGPPLTAGKADILIYGLINAAALTRVIGGLMPAAYHPLLIVSAGLWSAAFLAFVISYGPILLTPRLGRG